MSKSSMLVFACLIVTTGGLTAAGQRPLDFEERISARSAIEGVYWRHRTWPSDNTAPKPSLDQVLPENTLRARVKDDLLKSKALESLWGRRIRDEELRAEVERMAESSRAPQVLLEIFAALGNDPILVSECLARPLVTDRLIRDAYAHDPRYHAGLKTAIERSLARHKSVDSLRSSGGQYGEAVWMLGRERPTRAGTLAGGRITRLDPESWRARLSHLREGFNLTPVMNSEQHLKELPVGVFGLLQEDKESYFVQAVLDKDADRLRVATVVWQKQPFDEWWARTKATLDSDPLPEGAPIARRDTFQIRADGAATVLGVESISGVPPLPGVSLTGCTSDTWAPVESTNAPSIREAHTAVWTGMEMIVWGGYNGTLDINTGGRYTPATNSWVPTATTGAPDPRDTHTAVWTGTKMVVWGGGNEVFVPKDTGGRYDPTTNSWLPSNPSGAPTAREYHTALWTGSKMVVWGGWDGNRDLDTGGRYDPVADSWATTAKPGAPSARDAHTAVWTGTRMIVWGGEDDTAIPQDTGSRYDPVGNLWSVMTTTAVPSARWLHTSVWTGSRMIVWGGFDGATDLDTGGNYDPAADAWAPTSTIGAPTARDFHTAVWADSPAVMIVWGGQDDGVVQLNTGGRFNPTTNLWTAISSTAAPIGRRYHSAIWSGSEMITWGGWNIVDLNSGGRYCSLACTSSPPAGTSDISLSVEPGGARISWTLVPAADSYDLVRGSLSQLRGTGGDFSTSTQTCLANDQAMTSYLDPNLPPGVDGFWYLVRGMSCGGAGTYDDIGGSQIGSRDSEINASLNRCP